MSPIRSMKTTDSVLTRLPALPAAVARADASSAHVRSGSVRSGWREWPGTGVWRASAAMAVFFHLFVTGYEERTLRRRFGRTYLEYRRTVSRWIPRPPRRG